MVCWCEPVSAQGQDCFGDHGDANRGQGERRTPDCGAPWGSAHDEAELAALMEAGRQKIAAWQCQGLLDLESLAPSPDVPAWWVPRGGQALGSAAGGPARGLHPPGAGRGGRGDRAFEQMVLARLIEPSSRDQVPRVLGDLGLDAVSVRTFPWDVVSSGATGRRSLRPCSITSSPPGYWPCACRGDHALLRG